MACSDTNPARYSIFKGGVLADNRALRVGSDAAAAVAKFGGMSAADVLAQIQDVYPGVVDLTNETLSRADEDMQYNDGTVVSASYALGIASGQAIDVTFNAPVAQSIKWSAPLNVAVTYN